MALSLSFVLVTMSFITAQRTITGTVTDAESNEALIGANVLIKDSSVGTITDFDGTYSLTVPAGTTTLVVSYTGYDDQDVLIGSSNVVDVALTAGQLLDEVTVIGYGTMRRRDVTGSVASLKEEDFNKGIIISPDQLIQGRVPGVNVINNSGQPGGEASVKIRGNSSIRAGANPLYVIDGVPLDGRSARALSPSTDIGSIPNSNPLNFLNPSDIQNIDVLKDASSAAIYGSRGANGVILVTTKKGRIGEPQIDLSATYGVSTIARKYDVLTADEYVKAQNIYGLNNNGGGNVDAFDAITRSAVTQRYNFSIGGGTENGTYRIGAGIVDQEGIIKDSGLKRYSGSLNAGYKFLDNKAGVDVLLITTHAVEDIAPVSTNAGFTGNLVGQALQWNPTIPLMSNGDFTTATNNSTTAVVGATTINPLQLLAVHNEVANTTSILANLSPYINITDNLQYRYRFGINHGTGTSTSSIGGSINVQGIEGRGFASSSDLQLTSQVHTHTLTYTKNLNSNVALNAVAGYEYQKFDRTGSATGASGFSVLDFDNSNVLQNADPSNYFAFSFAEPINELQSYFGRVNASINEKYSVTATLRADGSSKFGENNRYGIFPSFAAAWNMSSEDFMADGSFDNLKLRAGWGQTGNQEFPAGASQTQYALVGNKGVEQLNTANPDLKWETSTTLNVGLDFALFDYKLSGTVEWYNRSTKDLLLDPFVSEPGPAVKAWKNISGNVKNSGVELSLNAFVLEKEGLSLQIGTNVAFLSNEFTGYEGAPIPVGDLFGQGASGAFVQKVQNNQPLNIFETREYLGLNDAGTSEYTDGGETLVFLGDPNAKTVLGITTNLIVGDLSFSTNWNGAFGHDLYNNTAMTVIPIGNLNGSRNVDYNLVSASLASNTPVESLANPITASSRYIESGNYLKLSNATVSYDLGNIGSFKNARISLTGQNLLTLTNYTGFDPEVNTVNLRNGVPSTGIEYIPYPTARSIIVGLGVSF